jgi:beta-1,4-mannooligosaccharide/beta-1,4-mannosyl-N-acetylglucosamine phosphorylase
MIKVQRDVIHRYQGNPIIGIEDLPFRCSDIWNAGVVRFQDRYLLRITVETPEGLSDIYRAYSTDGQHFSIQGEAFLGSCPGASDQGYRAYGVHDARVTQIDDTYYVLFVAVSRHGQRLGLAQTWDFQTIDEMHYVSEPDNKSAALFPCQIDGQYVMLERPLEGHSIWLSYSRDLVYWGQSTVVMTPRSGYWDCDRVGTACPPIEIDQGWLLIYYGEKHTSAGPLLRLGAAILDRDDPSQVLARSNIPILSPHKRYERIGDVGNVVFSCGAILENGDLKLYYGASDSCICLGTCSLDDILRVCRKSQEEY